MEEVKRGRGRPPRAQHDVTPPWDESISEEEVSEMEPGFERVIVARGRTLLFPHPTQTKIVREGEDGKPVRAPVSIECGEGVEVNLDSTPIHPDGKGGYFSEAQRLINLGIVHRPGEPQMVPAAFSEGSRVVEIGNPRGQQSPVNQAMRT